MKVILFGATGMVGRGVLRECLRDAAVESVLVIGRTTVGVTHPKLREIVRADLTDLGGLEGELSGYDACFFCLGVSSAGMKEAAYREITYDLTLSVARTLAASSPGLTFCYVSGQGTDSSARGRVMWARVKGETENALLALDGVDAYMFRPGLIQPLHGITSKTRVYRMVYAATGRLLPLLRKLAPRWITTTEQVGLAMVAVARGESGVRVLETAEINRLAGA
ncbi:NAD-dependent epimerase/dehydratase family protein [Streptomyces sp. BH-SS-21]|uniref:NAD-dependent epimerase/dehydratase family protein n=1 Tax=Streptomyces liliiviolaceus TaxID=2823109 RepID=A0A940XP41_9ACTN|nr:NAD-dependent epimerase/dehydratase family protein [Streptomyces liliiviolaceus]MBQ0847847.1 NAD-dependent epimerase/dehydratase family protein [Streptomyces liliiviolaceus]